MPDLGSGRFGGRNLTGVYVREIKVESPPFDKMGELQDMVGRGAMSDENFFPAEQFDPDSIQDTIEELGDMIGNPARYRVIYDLIIRAPSGVPESAAKRVVMPKARLFARRKNPFTPEVLSVQYVGEADLDFDTSPPLGTTEYNARAIVKNF